MRRRVRRPRSVIGALATPTSVPHFLDHRVHYGQGL